MVLQHLLKLNHKHAHLHHPPPHSTLTIFGVISLHLPLHNNMDNLPYTTDGANNPHKLAQRHLTGQIISSLALLLIAKRQGTATQDGVKISLDKINTDQPLRLKWGIRAEWHLGRDLWVLNRHTDRCSPLLLHHRCLNPPDRCLPLSLLDRINLT